MATLQWFSFDLNGGGFELHYTEDAARNNAINCIQSAMSEVGVESFINGNETILWGRLDIKQSAKVVGDCHVGSIVELVDATE